MDKQLTIEEGNKIIAEFMGAVPCKVWLKSIGDEDGYECEKYKLPTSELEYHSSWDWLMPACHKWDCLTDAEIKEGTWPKYERLCDLLDRKVALYEIQPVWNQLVENLQWYNSIN